MSRVGNHVEEAMKIYQGALADIRKYGGRWEALKMRCFSVWIGVEAHCLPDRSKARARRLIEDLRKL